MKRGWRWAGADGDNALSVKTATGNGQLHVHFFTLGRGSSGKAAVVVLVKGDSGLEQGEIWSVLKIEPQVC